jgi:nitrogen fixation/metabolism regulation signal transduction histidine kinase
MEKENIHNDLELFIKKNHPHITSMAEAMQEMVVILDEQRRVIYFNERFKHFSEEHKLPAASGKRPGDAFNCIYALSSNQGCGSTGFCKYCGASRSITASIKNNEKTVDECRIVALNGNAFDLKVSASPLNIDGCKLTIYSIMDISSNNRKEALEKIFFHDINNIVNGISMIVELMKEQIGCEETSEDCLELLDSAVVSLNNEIKAHHILTLAEKDELATKPENFKVKDLITNAVEFFNASTLNNGTELCVNNIENISINTDKTILNRIITNMVKNACEASRPGDSVTIGLESDDENCIIFVNNPMVMNDEVKKSIFKRSFSTKGEGRGLGTYSMRLLSERYLKGKVYFSSEEGEGTTFYVKIPVSL